MNEPHQGPSLDELQQIASGFQRSRVLLSAFELHIFDVIGDKGTSAFAIAATINADERATERLLNALCVIGILYKEDGRYHNTRSAQQYLVAGRPDYLGGLSHISNLYDSWGTLTGAVRRGGPDERPDISDRGDEWLDAFIGAMHFRATRRGSAFVQLVGIEGVKRLLDVGGGSGAYAAAFVKAGQEVTATVFDFPNVLPITRRYLQMEGVADRVELAGGDFNSDKLPTGYDLVLCSHILHSNPPDRCKALLAKATASLNKGGRVAVQDFLVDESRVSPPWPVFFAINMLVAVPGGDTYTFNEIKGWMEEAGLRDIVRKDTDFGAGLVIGRAQGTAETGNTKPGTNKK